MAPQPRPDYISIHQSADILGVDLHFILRLIGEGLLESRPMADGNIAVDFDDVLWMQPVISVARDCYAVGIPVSPDDVEDIRYQQQLLNIDGRWHLDR